jgi:hypothetical protein
MLSFLKILHLFGKKYGLNFGNDAGNAAGNGIVEIYFFVI